MRYLIALLFICSTFHKSVAQSESKISVTPFTYNGNDIFGATTSLYLTTKDRKQGKNYIFLTEYMYAAICINGKIVKLKAVKPYTQSEEVYSGGKYEVILEKSNYTDAGYEQSYLDVVLTVKSGSNILYKRKVFGNLSE